MEQLLIEWILAVIKHLLWNLSIITVSTTAGSVGGATAERPDLSDFRFTKLMMDKSSPLLSLVCADGTVFDTVTVELCRSGSEKIKFMEMSAFQ
jgi:type VI secretion system secreted protein Hcp